MPNKLVSLWKSKFFKLALLILLFIAAALIIMAMWLGQEAGQFVIRVQSGDVQKTIAVTLDLDEKNPPASLVADPMTDMNDYSPRYFLKEDYQDLREICHNPGWSQKDNNSLYVYTFYIKNTSKSGGVGVNVQLTYSNVTNYCDEIIRVLTYYESYNVSDPRLYQKPDSIERAATLDKYKGQNLEDIKIEYPSYIITPASFRDSSKSSGGTVFDNQSINIGFGQGMNYVKYSVLLWLEGDDPDSDYFGAALFNGTIKFEMLIKVVM
ncbi:hypothetical protein EI71_01918 [Anaeroplasma bactoclasticum]|jgi:hypothetical protein|uniref:Uncharacterized protein n=1 Tax=Anaeroplasma bactoclasticum TaxID=2088 RepID=A0A397QV34_9MOLU|nr:hypothetical protein EI71_01918 [Anaeroplasma bactoclasticum]